MRQNDKLYVQVTQEIVSDKTEKREHDQLHEISNYYPKYVLMIDGFGDVNYKGHKTIHIANFLLNAKDRSGKTQMKGVHLLDRRSFSIKKAGI